MESTRHTAGNQENIHTHFNTSSYPNDDRTRLITREPGNFEELVTQHILQGDEDNQDNETVSITMDWQNRKISDLFNFDNPLWSSRYSRFASMSFDEELELYDLLELDAQGEEDQECDDIDLDGTTQDILGA